MNKLDVERILKDLNIPYTITGKNARIKCINPNHKDDTPSMYVSLAEGEEGVFHCFSCHYKGNLLSFVKDQLQLSDENAQKYVSDQKKGGSTEEERFAFIKQQMGRRKKAGSVYQEASFIPKIKPIIDNYYLTKRGFTSDEISKWGICTVNEPGKPYHGWIYIPIYFQGMLRTWFLRSTTSNRKLYGYHTEIDEHGRKINVGYPRSDILYGYDELPEDCSEVYLFEGIFDKIWFERTKKHSLALLGNRISEEQQKYLKRFKSVFLALDNDEASFFIVKDALNLAPYIENLCIWTPPPGKKDANECTELELMSQFLKEQRLQDFIESERYIKWYLKTSTRAILKPSGMNPRSKSY
jgi:DNA primase